jgi:hypothetical protein
MTRSRLGCVFICLQFSGLFKGQGLDEFWEARLRDGDHRRGLLPFLPLGGDRSCKGW